MLAPPRPPRRDLRHSPYRPRRLYGRCRNRQLGTDTGQSGVLELCDNGGSSEFGLTAREKVHWVRFGITSVRRGTKYSDTAISEIAFR